MIKGSCLCGSVQLTIKGGLKPISHCHCKTCQKSHAAAFGTVARVNNKDLSIDHGKDVITAYKASEHKSRYFCSKCGTQLYADFDGQDESVIRIAVLDGDIDLKPARHIFVEEKASWYDIQDDLPQFDQWPT